MTFQERKLEVFQFDKEGQEVVGTLKEVRSGTFGPLYDLAQENGKIVTIGHSTFLEGKISGKDLGKKFKIVFEGLQQSKVKGRNPAKILRVFVDDGD